MPVRKPKLTAVTPAGDGSEADEDLYRPGLDAELRDLYDQAGEQGVLPEVRLVRVKMAVAHAEGDDRELRTWMDYFIRLQNVAVRLGAGDDLEGLEMDPWPEVG
ncbi:MAG TPA: hypothetical protein VG815_04695 [Chloroflexota bacterium]|jgi:hypothetical protein|nr:hypothetical protein [Chloroflexota bacterium]